MSLNQANGIKYSKNVIYEKVISNDFVIKREKVR